MTKPLPRGKNRRKDKKYKEEYAKELISGIRYSEKLSIAHLCMRWNICRATYDNWVERYQEFSYAHERGKEHYEAYLMEKMHDALEGGRVNGAVLQFALSNIAGWSNKVDVVQEEKQIRSININILPAPENSSCPELPDNSNVVEGEIVNSSNVVMLHANKEES